MKMTNVLQKDIYGTIVSVHKPKNSESEDVMDTLYNLDVLLPDQETIVKVRSRFIIPYEITDVICVQCSYVNPKGPFRADKHPIVQISETRESNMKGIIPIFKGTASAFYESLVETKKDSEIFKDLSILACNYKRDSIIYNEYTKFIDDHKYFAFLDFWYYHKVLRQVMLLGVTSEEYIEFRTPCESDFYTECIKNPYKIYTIPMDKADNIANIMNLALSEAHKHCGKIVREIYKFINSKGWVGIREEFAKKHFTLNPSLVKLLIDEYGVVIEFNTLYLQYYHTVETTLAKSLTPREGCFARIHPDVNLSSDQQEAIEFALNNQVSIITGSAGTGKTTIIRELIKLITSVGMQCQVVSFTGKAVSRVKQVTGFPAMTIHRAIAKPIGEFDILIIDEISMVSNNLMYLFFSKYPVKYRIIMIGDPNQLPPIDWGNLTNELIDSIPMFKLTCQHRQESKDLTEMYDLVLSKSFIPKEGSENFCLVQGKLEKVYDLVNSLDSFDDLMVISPLNVDVVPMNKEIQKIYHSKSDPVPDMIEDVHGDRKFYVKDKVMMIENNYDHDLFNGDEGVVERIDYSMKKISVSFVNSASGFKPTRKIVDFHLDLRRFNRRQISEPKIDEQGKKMSVDQLIHSFAITVHRAQGSEAKKVIFYIDRFTNFLTNNVFYTGITRAKNKVWVVADHQVLNRVVQNKPEIRLDNLGKRIMLNK